MRLRQVNGKRIVGSVAGARIRCPHSESSGERTLPLRIRPSPLGLKKARYRQGRILSPPRERLHDKFVANRAQEPNPPPPPLPRWGEEIAFQCGCATSVFPLPPFGGEDQGEGESANKWNDHGFQGTDHCTSQSVAGRTICAPTRSGSDR